MSGTRYPNASVEEIRRRAQTLLRFVDELSSFPAEAGLSPESLERLREQLQDLLEPLDRPIEVAFIGEQSTGKSSILNDLLGLALPSGENGVDRCVTRILHPSLAPTWLSGKDAVGGVAFRDGQTNTLSSAALAEVWEQLTDLEGRQSFDDVREIVLLRRDPWLRHVVFVNTPGLVERGNEVQAEIAKLVDRSALVFWVFDAKGVSHRQLGRQLQETLASASTRTYGIVNKVDQIKEEGERVQLVGRTVQEVKSLYGDYLTEVLAYSTRRWAFSDKDRDVGDFREQLRVMLDDELAKAADKVGGVQAARERVDRLAELVRKESVRARTSLAAVATDTDKIQDALSTDRKSVV